MEVKQISKLTSEEKSDIDHLIDFCRFSTPFHKIEWLSIIEELFNEKVYYLFHCDSRNKIDFALPFILKKEYMYYNLCSFSSKYELVYGGPLFSSRTLLSEISIDKAIVKDLKRVKSSSMTAPPKFDIAYLNANKIKHIYNTLILDLKPSLNEICGSFKNKNVRRNIRKAIKSKVNASVNENEKIEYFYEWLALTYNRFNKKMLPLSYYKAVCSLPFVQTFSAKFQGRTIAIMLILTHKNTIYYWAGSSSLNFRQYRPNDFLYWEIIKWAKNNGYEWFDLLITHVEDLPGRSKFKLKFGGEIYPIYEYQLEDPIYQIISKSLCCLTHPRKMLEYISNPKRAIKKIWR